MNKLESVEKDIIQASVELDVNKSVDEIHNGQNNIEKLPIENIDSKEVVHNSLEIEQEDESEQSDITSQEKKVLSESSGTDEALEIVDSIIDRLNDEQNDPNELSFDEIVSKILTKEIKTNKDFRKVIEGRWTFKRGKTDRDLIPAIKAGKINDSEYDQELVKKNITKLLKKVN